jgi:hypothetical protein
MHPFFVWFQLLLASHEQTAASIEAFVRIGVVRQLALYSCQGIEARSTGSFIQRSRNDSIVDSVPLHTQKEAEVVAAPAPLKRDGAIDSPDYDPKKPDQGASVEWDAAPDEPLGGQSQLDPSEEVKSVDSAEDLRDDGVLDFGLRKSDAPRPDSARQFGGFTQLVHEDSATIEDDVDVETLNVLDTSVIDAHELRYIGAVFLEKLTSDDRCAPVLCTPHVIQHMSSLLAVARAEIEGP